MMSTSLEGIQLLPIVLYNGKARWRVAAEVIAPVGSRLAPYQPPRCCFVVDERHVGAEDLPGADLMKAVSGLEQSTRRGTWCGSLPWKFRRLGRKAGSVT